MTGRPDAGDRTVAIALHDVSPATWPMCERLLRVVHDLDTSAPVTLLVVPQMHRRASIDEATAWRGAIDALIARGDEIALHGLWHIDDGGPSPSARAFFARRFLTAGEAEFSALDEQSARDRIDKGLALLTRCGWHASGFVPPAWQISERAYSAVASFRFEYITSFGSLAHLPTLKRCDVPCLVFSSRSPTRRAVSIRWMAWRLAQLANTPAIRIALHPQDACHAGTLEAWRQLLESVLRDRRAVTKSQLCQLTARSE